MKKLFLIFSTITVAFFSCQSTSKPGLTIRGQLKNHGAATRVYLEELTYSTRNTLDSTELDLKGKFMLEGALPKNGLFQLRIGPAKGIFLVLDEKNSNVELTADTSDITNYTYKIKGSPASEQMRKFIVQTKTYGEAFGKAMSTYKQNVNAETPDSIVKKYEDEVAVADSTFRLYARNFADTATNPIVAIFAVSNLDYERDRETYDKLVERVKPHATLPFVQTYVQMVNAQQSRSQQNDMGTKFQTGAAVPDIELQDVNGNMRKLSSLHGSVVLLDFWASWCGPCRRENPTVVRAYETFKDKGFTVFSVSLDNNKEKWLQGIKKDQLMWPDHVSDLKGWKSSVCETYGVSSIPQNYLLDKEGKIIAANLRGEALIKTLESIFQ
ncbi:MAG: AhpC/TSA family protein [Chitinophagales bacterium]|nr:AhpC/TSA family protein [Chitinophagales bacterium]